MASKTSLTATQAGERLIRTTLDGEQKHWNAKIGQATEITYSYRASVPSNYIKDDDGKIEKSTFSKFTASQIAITEQIFALFEDVCNVTLTRVGSGYSNKATFLLANFSDADQSDTYGYSWAVNGADRASASRDGDFWYNLEGPHGNGGDPKIAVGSDDYNTIMHELGHSLGLDHPSDYPDDFTYAHDASYREDSLQYSVMSYFDAAETGAVYKGAYSKTLGIHDIAALQLLYGANKTTRAGGDIYGFGGKGVYGVEKANEKTVFAVWDTGGVDTFDFSKNTTKQTIDLGQEKFSSTGGLTFNISIAKGTVIENAVGGTGADLITGNAAANILNGGKGNDVLNGLNGNDRLIAGLGVDKLDGGAGNDTADFSKLKIAVDVTLNGAGWEDVSNVGDDSFDLVGRVRNIENAVGTSGDDVLSGDMLANTLSGGAGDDILEGSAGRDTLAGGSGDDSFFFTALKLAALGLDKILDFARGDQLALDGDTTFANATGEASDFSSGAKLSAMVKDSHLFFNTANDCVYYDNDGAGEGATAVAFARLANDYKLSASDIYVFAS